MRAVDAFSLGQCACAVVKAVSCKCRLPPQALGSSSYQPLSCISGLLGWRRGAAGRLGCCFAQITSTQGSVRPPAYSNCKLSCPDPLHRARWTTAPAGQRGTNAAAAQPPLPPSSGHEGRLSSTPDRSRAARAREPAPWRRTARGACSRCCASLPLQALPRASRSRSTPLRASASRSLSTRSTLRWGRRQQGHLASAQGPRGRSCTRGALSAPPAAAACRSPLTTSHLTTRCPAAPALRAPCL